MMILRELFTKETVDPETKSTYQYMVELKGKLELTCKLTHKKRKDYLNR